MFLIKFLSNLFLVKEIRSKTGELHFQRWILFAIPFLPYFRVYLHKICKSDEDKHLHTHPWNFHSFILKGGYWQEYWDHPLDNDTSYALVKRFNLVSLNRHEGHKITLTHKPTWTLVFAYGKYSNWGYLTERGYIDHVNYRVMKNDGAWK